jgi:hypothetical protein
MTSSSSSSSSLSIIRLLTKEIFSEKNHLFKR